MKKSLTLICLLGLSLSAWAGDGSMPPAVAEIAHRWASINYHSPEKEQAAAFKALAQQAEALSSNQAGKAEALIWQAIVLSSQAKADGGLGALGLVKQARELLLDAEKIDPRALNGSIYSSLGSLYAKVPGWPIGFGDRKLARQYLDKALQIAPDSIDAHYFLADLLNDQGEYTQAIEQLRLAAAAPARTGREDADAGRRQDIASLLERIKHEHPQALAQR